MATPKHSASTLSHALLSFHLQVQYSCQSRDANSPPHPHLHLRVRQRYTAHPLDSRLFRQILNLVALQHEREQEFDLLDGEEAAGTGEFAVAWIMSVSDGIEEGGLGVVR